MTDIFTMKGILRGKNTDPSNGLPVGAAIERIKDGKPDGQSRGYWLQENKIEPEAVEALKDLNVGEEISYQSKDYRVLKIGKPGAFSNGNGYKKPYDPVADAKRQQMIIRQSCLDRAVTLWLGVKPGTKLSIKPADLDEITSVADHFVTWVNQESSTSTSDVSKTQQNGGGKV